MARREINIPVFDHSAQPNVSRMPSWVRQSLSQGHGYADTARTVHGKGLHTVCESARCPNQGECWSRGTATFMLLGEVCTRACGFCAVTTGTPPPPQADEPQRIAEAVATMGIDYVVLTSVNRDELSDGGAAHFAETLQALRALPDAPGLEILTPDFRACQEQAVERITAAMEGEPLVWGHNVETVPSLYKTVRKGSRYERSLELIRLVAQEQNVEAKSALMLGLGESEDEVLAVMDDLLKHGVTRLALGQYLRPTRYHLPVREYITPERFAALEQKAQERGFSWVKAGAMVRSSYHAEE